MNDIIAQRNIVFSIYNRFKGLNLVNILLSSLITIFLLVINFEFDIGLYLLGLIIGVFLAILIVNYPKIWLYSFGVMIGFFFHSRGEGVSVIDIAASLFFNGSIYIWFVNKTFLQKERTAFNLGDWLIISFFVFLVFNSIVAYLNDVNMLSWTREYLVISIILVYFPIRSIINTKEELKKFMIFLSLVIIGVGLFQGYLYYTKLHEIILEYAFELKTGVSINQTLYIIASIFGFIFTFNQVRKRYEISLFIFTSISVLSLIATFSRTFWVILMAFIFAVFIFFPTNKKIKTLNYLIFLAILFFVLAYFLMGNNLFTYIQVVVNRFTSSADGTKDLSVMARLVEWEEVIRQIMLHPLGGNGLGKVIRFYSVIELFTIHTDIIHNGFLYILFRAGIPTSLLFFGFHIFYTIKSYNLMILSSRTNDYFFKSLSVANCVSFVILYIVNFTSSQYFYRDGIIVTALLVVFICLNEKFLTTENTTRALNISNS